MRIYFFLHFYKHIGLHTIDAIENVGLLGSSFCTLYHFSISKMKLFLTNYNTCNKIQIHFKKTKKYFNLLEIF